MGPGKFGANTTTTGTITSIQINGQAHHRGIKIGWTIVKIDDEPWSPQALIHKIAGAKNYDVVLDKNVQRVCKIPRIYIWACCL